MSSTTRRANHSERPRGSHRENREHGQILVIFAGGLVAFLAVAALVFDVGQNLIDWRTQRDAADAAALAGSRYIADPACVANPAIANCLTAYQAALRVASLNGYGDLNGDGTDDRGHVEVHIPAIAPGDYTGRPGFLQVDIHTDRPSFFAAVLGMLHQNVDALAIAGNSTNVAPPYSMLALSPDCPAGGQVTGSNANVTVLNGGTVVVNSDCDPALQVNGGASLTADECDVVGTAPDYNNGDLNCPVNNFDGTGDPLITMGPGAMPDPPTPAAVEILKWNGSGTPKIPDGCPGSTSFITYVGVNFAAGTSATLPGFTIGDLAIVFAYRTGTNTPPAVPSGWSGIISGGSDSNSRSIGYRTLDGSETDTGVWTNATALEVIVLRGQDSDAPIGVKNQGGSTGNTMTTPALSGMRTDGHSWVIAFGGATSGANVTTLSGTTALSTALTPPFLALHTADNLISWSGQDYGGSVVGPNRTDAIEILANPNPSTEINPAGCSFSGAGAGKYNVFRMHPGVYWGGFQLSGRRARVYMAPGTYWLAGGGLSIRGNDNQLVSVNGASSTTPGRGVFIYDTEDAHYHDQCAVDPTYNNGCIGPISVNGGSSNACTDPPQPDPYDISTAPTQPCQWVHLEPTDSPIKNLLIFIDRAFSGVDVTFNGDAGKLDLAGTIYDPWGQVKINGGADDTVSAQIIAYTFLISGNGNFTVTYDANGVVQLSGVGLVQ